MAKRRKTAPSLATAAPDAPAAHGDDDDPDLSIDADLYMGRDLYDVVEHGGGVGSGSAGADSDADHIVGGDGWSNQFDFEDSDDFGGGGAAGDGDDDRAARTPVADAFVDDDRTVRTPVADAFVDEEQQPAASSSQQQ